MLAGILLVLSTQIPAAPATPPPAAAPEPVVLFSYVPERVYDSREKKFTDFEAMLAKLSRADVVIVGEQHDDRNTHRLEQALLEGLMRRRARVTLSLEMFERDVQAALSAYLAGTLDEEAFLKSSRPWPRYLTDYRPLVEFSRAHGWPVVASNVPRRVASQVSKQGLTALDQLPPEDRALVARSIECPSDKYRERFAETITQHPMPGSENLSEDERRSMIGRFYLAQCVKDETMAEAIVAARGAEGNPLVVHYTGSFHSDFGHGTAARVKRRLRDAKVVVLTVLPVDNLDALSPSKEDRKRADYLVYTLEPPPSPHAR